VPTGEARRPRRVGHKGAALLAPGNTLEAFDAALAAGVDMIEFDVLSEHRDGSGALFVAHDYDALGDAESRLSLDDALSHLACSQFAGLELDVDLKLPRYGGRVVAALRDFGLAERALISCTFIAELDRVRHIAPEIKVGWSVPRARRDYMSNAVTALPAFALLHALRAWLPRRVRVELAARRFDAVMAHWRLVSRSLVEAVHSAEGELYVWTVDDAALIQRLEAIGVDGVITNDPRLFAAN
jgi:glycerophosphoryl diester phosphodiesterase